MSNWKGRVYKFYQPGYWFRNADRFLRPKIFEDFCRDLVITVSCLKHQQTVTRHHFAQRFPVRNHLLEKYDVLKSEVGQLPSITVFFPATAENDFNVPWTNTPRLPQAAQRGKKGVGVAFRAIEYAAVQERKRIG